MKEIKSFVSDHLQTNTDAAVKLPTITAADIEYLKLTGRNAYWKKGYYGQGVTVAVIDTGINPNHNELKGRTLPGIAFDWYSNGVPKDDVGHGTQTASLICGATIGMAPQAKVLPIKTISPMGGENLDVIKALEWLVAWRDSSGQPVDIVSMSLSCFLSADQKVRMEAAIKALNALNVIVIVSAGNDGETTNVCYPANFYEPITVGAVDYDKKTAYFSTRSPEVDVCQLGVDVIVADYETTSGYTKNSGTSFSTPIVAGLAALLCCEYKAVFKKRINEMTLYEALKMHCFDIEEMGIDNKTGAGFCTLNSEMFDINFWIDVKYFTVNSVRVDMDTAPFYKDDRTMVPLRYISEALNCQVKWIGTERRINIQK